MLGSAELVAFLATDDPARARAFYSDVLGLRLVADEAFALVYDASGTPFRIQKVPSHAPLPYTALGWIVSDIDGTIRHLLPKGVTFERFPGLTQDDAGVWVAPQGAKIAWFKDPDGNIRSLTEPSAASRR